MSMTIDERVVEMRFDNKQFEAGAKETISTLSRLKEALNFKNITNSLLGLNKSTKETSFAGLISGVETLNKRFSTLGIVGMTIIQNITNALIGKLNNAINTVSNSIVSGGIKRAMNIENAHYQLQALLNDEEKVQAIMADAMESVDGTAYAYDEAAKAASQFAATGLRAGEEMQAALRGITGVAAMTNSSFEEISFIFTTVAGNGRLMGDQLLQLSSRGLNAASTIAQYFREVRGQADITEATIREMVTKGQISFKDFSDAMTWAFGDSAKRANETFTGAMANMKSALARIGAGFISPLIEQNGELVQLFNAVRIKINDVKSALVFDEQRSAISGLAKATGMTDERLGKMFNTIKSKGAVSVKQLDKLTNKGADATTALTKYINGVSDGSIRASYSISKAVKDLTNGTEVSTKDIRRFVKEGKIDLQIFTSAMETEFGTEMTLSKQFTDFALENIHRVTEIVSNIDLTKPMEAFYNVVGGVQNVFKGLYSIIKPVGIAFKDVFLNFNSNDVVKFSKSIEDLTSKFKLSKEGSKNLHDAMEGLFNVVKLVGDGFFNLISAIFSINKPLFNVNGGVLNLVGSLGRMLTSFTKFIRSSELLNNVFSAVHKGLSAVVKGFANLLNGIIKLSKKIANLSGTKKIISAIYNLFTKLSNVISEYVSLAIDNLGKLFKAFSKVKKSKIDKVFDSISKSLSNFAKAIKDLTFESAEKVFDALIKKIKGLNDLEMPSTNNLKTFGDNIRKALSFDDILDKMENIMNVFGKFFDWIKNVLAPAFEGFNVGSFVATSGMFGVIYAVMKIAKAFENISNALSSIPDFLGGIQGALTAYQNNLNASALIKIAGAIAILAGALALLSLTNTTNLLKAATALSLVGGVLVIGLSKLQKASDEGPEVVDSLMVLAEGLSNTMQSFGKAAKIKALGGAVKQFAESIAIVAGSIITLGIMYKKDKESLLAGTELVAVISSVMVGIMAGMSILGNFVKGGMKNFSQAALGILSLSLSLTLCIRALTKLFGMEFPSDWKLKLEVLAGMLTGLGVLAVLLGAATKLAGGGKLASGSFLSISLLLFTTISSLNKLFKMEFPSDWKLKLTVFAGVFAGIGALMIAMGAAAKLAGGTIKTAGSLLAMSVFLVALVGALTFLSNVPFDKLLSAATSLGLVLTTLGIALYGAGKISTAESAKSILTMAITVGAITTALGVLSMIPFPKLLKGATTLGSILMILALDFVSVSKITNEKAWVNVVAMIAAIAGITASLYILSTQPWENILASCVALSSTMLALSVTFDVISKSNPNLASMAVFLAATVALGLIALEIYALSKESQWQSLLATAASLSAVLLAMSVTMGICSAVGSAAPAALIGLGLLDAFIANFALVLVALGAIFKSEGAKTLMSGGAEILVQIGQAIGNFVGAIVNGVLTSVSSALPQIANDLSAFMTNLQPFISGSKNIDAGALASVGLLAGIILALTAAEIINGITSLFGLSLVDVAVELSSFMIALAPFIMQSRLLKEDSMKACQLLATMIITLTAAELIAGIGRFFGLSGALSDFGKQLAEFGPYIKKFSEDVKGVNPQSVKGAAAAAEIMANLANKLPATGGLVQKIFGERSLSQFGTELVAFGPYIKQFANQVKEVNPSSVKGAAAAAEIMANLANKLPPQGGLVQKIFGERSLAEFGAELTKFGPRIAQFANQVKEVNPSSVVGASAAANIMASVANNLPSTETLWNKIFGGGKATLSQFGTELVSFGKSMSSFSYSVSGINVEQINGAISSFKALANLATSMESVSATGLLNFSNNLSKIGTDGVSKFVQAFSNAGPSAAEAVNNLFTTIINAIKGKTSSLKSSGLKIGEAICLGIKNGISNNKKSVISASSALIRELTNKLNIGLKASVFNPIGQQVITGLINGMNAKKPTAMNAANSICTDIINKFKSSLSISVLGSAGQNVIQGLINGMNAKKPTAMNAANSICTDIINKFKSGLPNSKLKEIGKGVISALINGMESKEAALKKSVKGLCNTIKETFKNNLKKSSFESIGKNAALGLKDGITSKTREISNAAINAARSAVNSAKSALKVKSPSRVFFEIGKFVSLGLADGITDYIRVVEQASSKLSKSSIKTVEDALDKTSIAINSMGFDSEPVIRPIVDLSNVSAAANQVSSTFRGLDLSTTMGLARSISNGFYRNGSKYDEKNAYNKQVERKLDQLIKNDENEPRVENTNTFYIQSTDPKQAAEEIGYIMQHKVERGMAVWAR